MKLNIKRPLAYLLSLTMLLSVPVVSGTALNQANTANAKSTKLATFAYLDVGQGNAEIIKAGGKTTLIDTGKRSEYDELKTQLNSLKIHKINTLIITHPDADHMENAGDIIRNYKVKKIIMPKIKSATICYKKMTSAISDCNVTKVIPSTNNTLKHGKGCKGKVLSVDAKNEASIVLRVTYGKRSFLYMGDATARVENNITSSGANIGSDIYLLSHHGSDTANGILFQKKALASKYGIAIVSVGNNSYGHPDKFVMGRANKFAKKIYRTDKNGCIIAKTNGNNLKFTFKKVAHSSSSYSYSTKKKSSSSTSSSSKTKSKSSGGGYVYITRTGTKYHKLGCRYLRQSSSKISRSSAKAQGYSACSVCCP